MGTETFCDMAQLYSVPLAVYICPNISGPPPRITGIRNESVTYRQTAFLHCPMQSSEQARITWSRHGYLVFNSAKFYAASNGTLSIFDVTREDAGPYTCSATTRGGSDQATIHLSVLGLPPAVRV